MQSQQFKNSEGKLTISLYFRSFLFWKRGLLKKMQLEKLEINNKYWAEVKVI